MSNNTPLAHLGAYTTLFTHWANPLEAKLLGPKPTAEMFNNTHGLGPRPGKQALAIAMSLRPCGVTAGQVQIACGAPQRNKMTDLEKSGVLAREHMMSNDGHTVYKHVVTPKGLKRIETAVKAAEALIAAGKLEAANDKADKPAKAPKLIRHAKSPRKAKATPVTAEPQVTGDTAPDQVVNAPVTEAQTEAALVTPTT